jgi:hypothetical protein
VDYIIYKPANWEPPKLDKKVTVKLDASAIKILDDIKKWTREDSPNHPKDSYDDALKLLESIAMFDSELAFVVISGLPYQGTVRVEKGLALDKPPTTASKEVKLSERTLIPLRNLQKELRKDERFDDCTLSGCIRYLSTLANRRKIPRLDEQGKGEMLKFLQCSGNKNLIKKALKMTHWTEEQRKELEKTLASIEAKK